MRALTYLFIITLMIGSNFNCYSQSDAKYVLHIIDTSYHNNDDSFIVNHKILVKNGNSFSEVLSILNYSEDFYIVCSYLDSSDCAYFVFCNYGSAAGVSKVYYIDPKSKSVFESSSLFEYEIPLYTSFTKGSSEIRMMSFKDGDCGKITSKRVELYQSLKQLKTYTTVPKKFIKKRELPY